MVDWQKFPDSLPPSSGPGQYLICYHGQPLLALWCMICGAMEWCSLPTMADLDQKAITHWAVVQVPEQVVAWPPIEIGGE